MYGCTAGETLFEQVPSYITYLASYIHFMLRTLVAGHVFVKPATHGRG